MPNHTPNIDMLRDIHLPEAISMGTDKYLIITLAMILGAIVIALICYFLKKLLRPTLKKEALFHLAAIEESFLATSDSKKCLMDLSGLLRRVAITKDKQNASLTGINWLKYLDGEIKQDDFENGVGRALLIGPYSRTIENTDVYKLIDLCKRFLEAQ